MGLVTLSLFLAFVNFQGTGGAKNVEITYVTNKFVMEPPVPIGQNASLSDIDDISMSRVVCRLVEAPFAGEGKEFLRFNRTGTSVGLTEHPDGEFNIIYTLSGGLTTAEYQQVSEA